MRIRGSLFWLYVVRSASVRQPGSQQLPVSGIAVTRGLAMCRELRARCVRALCPRVRAGHAVFSAAEADWFPHLPAKDNGRERWGAGRSGEPCRGHLYGQGARVCCVLLQRCLDRARACSVAIECAGVSGAALMPALGCASWQGVIQHHVCGRCHAAASPAGPAGLEVGSPVCVCVCVCVWCVCACVSPFVSTARVGFIFLVGSWFMV